MVTPRFRSRRSGLHALHAGSRRRDRAVRPPGHAVRQGQAGGQDLVGLLAALAALNLLRDRVRRGETGLAVAAALLLVAGARRQGLTWEELGLARAHLRRGAGWALASTTTVAVGYLAGVLLPPTRRAFLDPRYDLPPGEALVAALVAVPLRTVLLEEVAFRSVLWATLSRRTGTLGVLTATSALFGLWHVLPALHFSEARAAGPAGDEAAAGGRAVVVVAGTVAFTAVGGAVGGELRRRSDSVVASAGMHWATNGLGILFGLAARRLAAL